MDQNEFAVLSDGNLMKDAGLAPEQREGLLSEEEDDWEFVEKYESEEAVARGLGFYVDDDGHWQELDDEDW